MNIVLAVVYNFEIVLANKIHSISDVVESGSALVLG